MYLQVVAATVILACGIIIGSGAALLYFKDDIVRNPGPPPREVAREVRARYGLTEEQSKKVEAALEASWERMRTFFEGIREKTDAEFKELSAAMKVILTPEQFKRWERDFKDGRRRGPRGFGGRPGPGSRPGSGRHRPGGWPGGPGGGRSGQGRTDPNGKPRQDRRGYLGFRPGQRGSAEPNSQVE
jgi:hypothetical protein